VARTMALIMMTGLLLLSACAPATDVDPMPGGDSRVGTAEQRAALFDEIIAMTVRREAFSPVKEDTLGFSPLDDMGALRNEFVGAVTEADLYYALVKLSNARRDHHRAPETPGVQAPIRVLPDYTDLDDPSFFIAATEFSALDLEGRLPAPGDLIVGVNGRSIAEYIETFTPWVVHSSIHGLYWDMARDLPLRPADVPPSLYGPDLQLELEDSTGGRYSVSLPYLATESLQIPPAEEPLYPGFSTVMERVNFNVLLPDDGRDIVLLQWLDFEYELIQEVVDLMEFATRRGLLSHTLVIDVTDSSGGSRGAYAIQRLVDRPFRTTFGNVRLSDGAESFIRRWATAEDDAAAPEIFGLNESGSWLHEWARTDAVEALERGDDYTAPVPFKLAHLPKESDGILQPAPVHFSGPVVIIAGPRGGSHLDQFVSMFADNGLAEIVGMPTGGYSNTWEAEELLHFPGTEQPVARFMWNIGHTLRPNGEILEGNPPWPDVYIPLTSENFRNYHEMLLDAALETVAHYPAVEIYRGHAVFGHEVRSFQPCGVEEALWVVDESQLLAMLYDEFATGREPYAEVFAVVEAHRGPAPKEGFGADYGGSLEIAAVLYAGLEGPGCDAEWDTFRYRARGNEPFWMIDVTDTGMRLSQPGEADIRWPEAARATTAEGTRFTASGGSAAAAVELLITRQDCRDSMSGAYFAFTATARFGDLELSGCTLVGARPEQR